MRKKKAGSRLPAEHAALFVFIAGCETFLLPRFPEPVRRLRPRYIGDRRVRSLDCYRWCVVPQITADERVDVACCTYRLLRFDTSAAASAIEHQAAQEAEDLLGSRCHFAQPCVLADMSYHARSGTGMAEER
jgi:hypothetical protein